MKTKNYSDDSSIISVGIAIVSFILGLLLIAGLVLYAAWASAVVITCLWSWFVVSTFGIAAITMPQAYGISLLLSYVTYQHYSHYDTDERELSEKIKELLVLLIRPWLILFIGWICNHFFM